MDMIRSKQVSFQVLKNGVNGTKTQILLANSPEIATRCMLSAKCCIWGILSPACLLLFNCLKLVHKTQQNKLKGFLVLLSPPSLTRQWDEAITT